MYVPTLRRVRRISSAQRTDAVSGTDFTFDDLSGFAGIPPQYEWKCLGEQDVLATVNTRVKAYPYTRDHNFGPYGLSVADDRWELRHALKIRFAPKQRGPPVRQQGHLPRQEHREILYSFAYDRKDELWKIIYHNKRLERGTPRTCTSPGTSVPEPRDNVNVLRHRRQRADRHRQPDRVLGPPTARPSETSGKIRRYIDVGSLTKGR